jgi:hypothetical protein
LLYEHTNNHAQTQTMLTVTELNLHDLVFLSFICLVSLSYTLIHSHNPHLQVLKMLSVQTVKDLKVYDVAEHTTMADCR